MRNLESLIEIAVSTAVKAGVKVLEIYNDPNSDFRIERKADNSPLTIADKESHKIIEENLIETKIPMLSEEGAEIPFKVRSKWDEFWLIDPIDGTKEFINKNGEFTINIALVERQEAVLGVIYVPVTGELYWGCKGFGAYKLIVNSVEKLKSYKLLLDQSEKLPRQKYYAEYRVVGSKSFMNKKTEEFINSLKEEHKNLEIIPKGSSLKICMVAEGSADIYPRFGPTMEWDTAAGNAIAIAAGKLITLQDQITPLKYNKENLLNPYFIVQ